MTAKLHHALLAAVLAVAGCGASSTRPAADDPYAVQVGAAGSATCPSTSASANATGAAATNNLRGRQGLSPVRPNAQLARVAAQHACDMAQRGRMTHIGSTTTGPGARLRAAGYQPRITAENIAAGPFNLTRVLGEWNASPGHVANIMLPQISDFGIGEAISADGRTRYWAAVYAAPG